MAGDIGQGFAEAQHHLTTDGLGDRAVDRSLDVGRRFESERLGRFVADGGELAPQAPLGRPSLMQFEDRRPHLTDRQVKIVDGVRDAFRRRRVARRLGNGLQGQAGGEQSLNDVVMQIASDPLAFVEQARGAGLLVETGVLDGQTRRRGKAHGKLLIDIGEHLTVGLVRQVQVAVHDASQTDGHAEERRHRRVTGREPETVRMGLQVGEPQRLRLEDQQTEDAVPLGPSADACGRFIGEADGDELGQTGSRLVEHPKGCILGVDQIGCGLGDSAQRVRERLLGPDGHDGVEQAEELFGPGKLETTGHLLRLGPAPLGCHRDHRDHRDGPAEAGPVVIRVFLVDDHEVVRRVVRELLESTDDLQVVGEAGTAAQARQRIPVASPDVAILDVRLPDGTGVEVCRDLRSLMPTLKCLMLTSFNDDEALFDAIMAGASGYVLKEVKGSDLVASVRRVADGQSLLDPMVTARVLERLRNPPRDELTESLTPQEASILAHLADGLTNREIAEQMFLAEKTVKNYVSNLLAKLGMHHRTQAAVYAARLAERRAQRPGP